MEVLIRQRDAIVNDWLERTLQTYPGQTSRFLRQEKDRFRNPVGHTLAHGLECLFDGLMGTVDRATAVAALEEIVKIRAVQDFTAGQALAFVFLLKNIVRERALGTDLSSVLDEIDRLALQAFDAYMQCRERIYEIQANEARRRCSVLERVLQGYVETLPGSS